MEHITSSNISDLKQDPKNANKGTKRGAETVRQSLMELGAGRSVLVDKHGILIAGNKTASAALQAGIDPEAIVVQTDGSRLVIVQRTDLDLSTDTKAKLLAIADNRSSELGLEWNPDILGEFAEEMDLQPFFTDAELNLIIPRSTGLDDEDDVPEPPVDPVTKLGDLILLGNHRLLCGDATVESDVARLMDGGKADMVFTDPPYGVSFQSGMSKGGTATRFDKLANDDIILAVAPIIWSVLSNDAAAFVWTSHHVYPVWREQFSSYYKQTLIWYKRGGGIGDLEGSYACDFEMCLFCVKGRPTFRGNRGMAVWDTAKDAAGAYIHPTQKPVALARRACQDFSDAGAIVVDLFGGSGSTLIACEQTGRTANLMELDPRYCDVIVARWQTATGKKVERL